MKKYIFKFCVTTVHFLDAKSFFLGFLEDIPSLYFYSKNYSFKT